jgi:threonylcarbamoyladenosine tRNA methylthiotransferase MtaB
MIGRESSVLFEREKDGYFEGYTSNYVKVKHKADSNLRNQIIKMRFISIEGDKLQGSTL